MDLLEWSWLNKSFVDYPPADVLIAGYLGYKAPRGQVSSTRDAARANAESLQTIIHPRIGNLGNLLTRGQKTINQMPEYVRSPEKMALIAKMRAEMTEAHAG